MGWTGIGTESAAGCLECICVQAEADYLILLLDKLVETCVCYMGVYRCTTTISPPIHNLFTQALLNVVYLKFKSPNQAESYIGTIKAYSKLAKASHLTTSSAKNSFLASLLKQKNLQVGQTTANYSDLSMSMPMLLVFAGVKSSVFCISMFVLYLYWSAQWGRPLLLL